MGFEENDLKLRIWGVRVLVGFKGFGHFLGLDIGFVYV